MLVVCSLGRSARQESLGAIRFEAPMHRDRTRSSPPKKWRFPPQQQADMEVNHFNLELNLIPVDHGSKFLRVSNLGSK